jgi:hypothetical protein
MRKNQQFNAGWSSFKKPKNDLYGLSLSLSEYQTPFKI